MCVVGNSQRLPHRKRTPTQAGAGLISKLKQCCAEVLDLKFGQVELRRDISIVLRHEPRGKPKRTMKAF